MDVLFDVVLFDFDGTLVEVVLDFERMQREVVALASRYGVASPRELYTLELVDHARRRLEARDPQAAQTFAREAERILVDIEMEGAGRAQPLPGVEGTLRTLRERGILVGIVTRNCRRAVERVLARLSLPYDLLLTRDDVARVKPDPAHLLEAVDRLNGRPERTLVVGDHPMDVLAGLRAGTCTAALTTTHSRCDFADVEPDLVLEDVSELSNRAGSRT